MSKNVFNNTISIFEDIQCIATFDMANAHLGSFVRDVFNSTLMVRIGFSVRTKKSTTLIRA